MGGFHLWNDDRAPAPFAQARGEPGRPLRLDRARLGGRQVLVGRVGVAGIQPGLRFLAVLDVEDLDGVVVQGLAFPLGPAILELSP